MKGEKEEVKKPVGIRKKGGDPEVKVTEKPLKEESPEPEIPPTEDVTTQQSEAGSPEVQETTEETLGVNPLEYLKDEKFINTYPDSTIDSIKSEIKEAKEGDLIAFKNV